MAKVTIRTNGTRQFTAVVARNTKTNAVVISGCNLPSGTSFQGKDIIKTEIPISDIVAAAQQQCYTRRDWKAQIWVIFQSKTRSQILVFDAPKPGVFKRDLPAEIWRGGLPNYEDPKGEQALLNIAPVEGVFKMYDIRTSREHSTRLQTDFGSNLGTILSEVEKASTEKPADVSPEATAEAK